MTYFMALAEDSRIVIESTASWYWLYDLLTAHGFSMVISSPCKPKAIASVKIKNDRLDSHMLAQLLRADMIKPVHVCSLQSRILKELLRHGHKLIQNATRMKDRIHILFRKNNCQVPLVICLTEIRQLGGHVESWP